MLRNGALALIFLVLSTTTLAEHVNCKPGEVAYETVRIGDQDVDLLTAGPGCPESAPRVMSPPPVADAAAPAAAEQGAAELVNDRPEAQAASAGAPLAVGGEENARLLPWLAAGSVALFVFSAAYGAHRVYDQKVRQPRLQAQEEEAKRSAEEQAGADLRAAEEGAREAEAREAREAAVAAQAKEAERRAREEAGRASRAEAERERYQEELGARERGAEEEGRLGQPGEADAAARHPERGAGGAAAKKRCGPIGCGGCGGAPRAAEPGPTGGSNR